MLLVIYIGPFIVLLVLDAISIYWAFSERPAGRDNIGWLIVGISLAVILITIAVWMRGGATGFLLLGMVVAFGWVSALQAPLIATLLSEALMPDPSKGLKVTSDHSKAESDSIKGDFKGAVEEFERAIAKDPDDVVAYFELAELYSEKKDYHKAVEIYERGLMHTKRLGKEQYSSAHTRLAEIYAHRLDNVDAARKHLQEIMKKYPGTHYANYAAESLDKL